ncbi:MAG: hypothetical protein OXG72_18180, partial [Acidobacteria bacterium]|nr:hypothetical protein [Acidobacteriota bacterium]
ARERSQAASLPPAEGSTSAFPTTSTSRRTARSPATRCSPAGSSTPPRSAGYAVRPVETGGVRLEVGVDAHVRESALFGGTDKGVMARASIGW